jgi:hypothetical protein
LPLSTRIRCARRFSRKVARGWAHERDSAELLERIRAIDPDVILIDLEKPES